VTTLADAALVESPRQFFRRHLQRHTSAASDLAWYLGQSVPKFAGSDEVRLAVEELVDRLGVFLGFGVARAEADDYALWTSPTGARLLVWVVDESRAVARVGAGSHTRDRLLASLAVPTGDLLSCLFVVCGPIRERMLDEAVALRRASRHVRLVGIDALATAGGLVETGAIAHEQALALLRPASALADGMIALLAPPAPLRAR
jgi:hypothetical protein